MSQPTNNDEVKSPCIAICLLDEDARECVACYRTLAEIRGWATYDDDEKRAVLARTRLRRAVRSHADAPPPRRRRV